MGIAADGAVLGNAWTITRGSANLVGTADNLTATAGDRIYFAALVKGSGLSGTGGSVDVWLRNQAATSMFRPMLSFDRDFGWNKVSCEAICPAATTSVRVLLQTLGAAGATLKIAQFTLRNLTALGVA